MNKKKVFGILFLTLIILGIIGYLSVPYYKAYKAGIKVDYFKNPKYCEQDSDCTRKSNVCEGPINIYNYKNDGASCLLEVCGPECIENKCQYVQCKFGGSQNE